MGLRGTDARGNRVVTGWRLTVKVQNIALKEGKRQRITWSVRKIY